MHFPYARRSQEDDPFSFWDEMSLAQIEDAFLVEGRQGRKVEIGDLLFSGETGFLEPSLAGFPLTLRYFQLYQVV
tara:strand:- start:23 stop:247 length:225 start_codon:yes stop_codon:yes gene_type:complete